MEASRAGNRQGRGRLDSQVSEPSNQASPGISKTSLYVAAGRAVGAREPDPSARNPDYLAEQLLGDPSELDLELCVKVGLEESGGVPMLSRSVRSIEMRRPSLLLYAPTLVGETRSGEPAAMTLRPGAMTLCVT